MAEDVTGDKAAGRIGVRPTIPPSGTMHHAEDEAPGRSADTLVSRTFDVMGGERVFRRRAETALEAHEILVGGVPPRALENVVSVLALSDIDRREYDTLFGVSRRTLQRLNQKRPEDQVLGTEVGDRTYRVAHVIARASDVLGSRDHAVEWLTKPAMALGYRKPLDLLATQAGQDLVGTLLTQIEYGVSV